MKAKLITEEEIVLDYGHPTGINWTWGDRSGPQRKYVTIILRVEKEVQVEYLNQPTIYPWAKEMNHQLFNHGCTDMKIKGGPR